MELIARDLVEGIANKAVQVFYLRDERDRKIVTIVTQRMPDNEHIRYSVTTYHEGDKYDKDFAKAIGMERLLKFRNNAFTGEITTAEPATRTRIVSEIASNKRLHQRTRDAAYRWLNEKQGGMLA